MDKIPFKKIRKAGTLLHAVSFLEPFNATGGVNKLLLTGEERMAGRADLRGDLRFGGTRLERIAAEAFHCYFCVVRVKSFFHIFLLMGVTPASFILN